MLGKPVLDQPLV